MFLSWCIITKDDSELPLLKKAIASTLPHIDELILVANGQETMQVEEFAKTDPKIKYFYHKWNDDFADQRNFAASKVSEEADYYGWQDSDDVVTNAQMLRDIATIAKQRNFDVVFFDYWYGSKFNGEPSLETFVEQELTQKRERLIRVGKVQWKKRIHETPVPLDGEHFNYSRIPYDEQYPITWLHLGADRDMPTEKIKAKMARNRRLLELELGDERKGGGQADPRTLLYLMKIYAEDDDPQILQTCIEMGKEYLEKSGWDMERAVCCQLMSKCMGKLGLHKEANKFLHDAVKEYPYDPLLYLYLARTYFNLGDYRAMKHWMQIGMNIDIEDSNNGFQNILEMKILSSELMLEYHLTGERNIRKAYEAAKVLNQVNPSENNKFNEDYLFDQKELDVASEHAHSLMNYLIEIGRGELVTHVYESMPPEMKRLPFAIAYYNRFSPLRVWKDNEICYFANFGGEMFEKWDGDSKNTGIGGSELAVIELSEQWTKMGYKVTVYGDPKEEKEINGVLYVPYYKFNQRDKFNIFIQWRQPNLPYRISAKKFYVDFHDIFVESTINDYVEGIDKFFVKSKYHRSLGKGIKDEKWKVVSNGI